MAIEPWLNRVGLRNAWAQEIVMAIIALVLGFAIMPVAIYYAGVSALGRYESASLSNLFKSIYGGLGTGSGAAWTVVIGPYVLYLVFKALRQWWRLGAEAA